MTQAKRNNLINKLGKDITREEKLVFLAISSLIGDKDEVDIDWDDLSEITGIFNYVLIEEMLDTMYDMEVISYLDYEEGVMG